MDKKMSPEEMRDYMAAQRAEMTSPFNLWVTGEELGRAPTPSEAAWHYMRHGGAIDFESRWLQHVSAR